MRKVSIWFLSLMLVAAALFGCMTVMAEETDPAVVLNSATGVAYEDLSKALAEAETGETLILQQDVGTLFLSVPNGVTVDLNGKTLTATYVSAFGNIEDGSAENTGLLKVDANKLLLKTTNSQLPVKTAEGYKFISMRGFNTRVLDGGARYVFQPLFEAAAHEMLKDGAAATGVSVQVLVTWKSGADTDSRTFVFGDNFVTQFVNSYVSTGGYGKMFQLTVSNPEKFEDLQYTAMVVTESGVTYQPAKLPAEVTEDVTLQDGQNSALVSAGTKLTDGDVSLSLVTTEMENTTSSIVVGEGETARSMDIHVNGLSKDNTVPVIVTVNEFAVNGLNEGNIVLYHVENGEPVKMTRVYSVDEVNEHNEYYYDIETGTVTMALASFSEITFVADKLNPWKGNYDYTWYDDSKAELTIANADQFAGFGAIVGGMAGKTRDSFQNKTVTLLTDLNIGDLDSENEFVLYPVGYYNSEGTYEKTGNAITSGFKTFEGTFDGAGHTIANILQNTWEMKGDHNWYDATLQYYRDGMGLFGKVYGGTVKNLTVKNFSSDGEITTTGCIAAYADHGATFENIAIFNCNPRVYNIGNGGIVGCVGWYNNVETDSVPVCFKNITVDNTNKISALWGSYDVACGGIVGQYYPISGQSNATANAGIHMENCHVAAQMDVYNDVCANYQYYAYRYTGMLIGSVRENVTGEDGRVYPKMDGITAKDCTVHFGTWNDYYYCEIIDNTTASYTHDYQMSRLTEIKAINGTTITYLDGTTGTVPVSGRANYVIVDYNKGHGTENATCYHFKDGAVWTHDMGGIQTGIDENGDGQDDLKEDKQHIYLEFNNLVTGYGWGVTSKGVGDMDGVKILDREVGNSVVKFQKAGSAKDSYTTGTSVTIGELFAATEAGIAEKTKIVNESVMVAVSPVGDDSTAGGAYAANAEDWTKGTLTFTGTGAATITITDYYFCEPTTIAVNVKLIEKFTAKSVEEQNAYTQIFLDDLFDVKNGTTIGNVTATVTDPESNTTTVTGTASDWIEKTIDLTKDGLWTVAICDDDELCAQTTVTFTVNKVDKFTKKFDKDFLYRIGNIGTVSLGTLFSEIETPIDVTGVTIDVSGVVGTASGTYTYNATWTSGTIQFNNTGVVKVTISADGANDVVLYLEVVDAKNTTTASFSGNTVLLQDVSASSTLSTSAVLYGNGFTINLENAPISEKNGAVFHLYDGAILKNVGIIGKEFTTVAMTVNDTNYGVSTVRAWGTVVIENSYISGCRSAVSVTGTELTIKDSVIANGVYANIDFRSGILNLHNVTTINEPHAVNGTTIVGLGVVGNMTASAGRQINITGTLTQYNWVSQADCANIKATGVDGIFNSVFTDSKYAYLRYTYNGTTYVNAGILSLCSDFGASAVTGVPSNYGGMDVTASISGVTVNGYVWAPDQAGTLTAADMKYHDTVYYWTANNQGTSYIPPSFEYENAGLDTENDVVQIEYENGSSYTLSADVIRKLLSPVKYDQALSYEVSMNGTDYTGEDIVFDAAASQTYTITYMIIDNLVYDKNGNLTNTTYEITKDLKVFATVVDKGADAPTFTFYYGTNGSASAGTPHTTQPTNSYTSTIKQVGETYYIMPNVSATTANAISSQTVDGQTIYYPIVDGINVRSGSSTDYDFTRYYPIFKAVKISDNGTEYSYSGTKEMPDTVAWVSATIDSGNGASALNDGFGLYNNQYLCKIQKKAGNAESGGTSVVKFSYTALDGNTYYYYIGFRFYDEDEGGVCVAPETLITLADGTLKRIDQLTFDDKVLAWDFFTGTYVAQDISLLVNHGEAVYTVTNLQFNDGTVLRIIGDHGAFDYDLNKFVYVTMDNMQEYIGHRFVQYAADGSYNVVTLTDAFETEEYTSAWSVSSTETSNAFASGILTVAPPEDFYNWVEMGDKLMYNVEKFQQDVETYGLYTYEDFQDYVTYEQFVAWNGAYLKIAVEKGCFTFEYILELIDLYKGWMPTG